MAVDAFLLAEPGDHVMVLAGDGKLEPMFAGLRDYDIKVTLVSTRDASSTIAPPSML
ncbi:NYN domain-containing protein, partial [Xanthomonas translucens pv. undulosa]